MKNQTSSFTYFTSICLIISSLACKSQTTATTKTEVLTPTIGGDFTISGKVKSAISTKVYLELLNERGIPTRLDSVVLDKNNMFSFKGNVAEPNIFQVMIGSQRVLVLLDGGENLTIEADGVATPDNATGVSTVKGSKAMDYFQQLNTFGQAMQTKAQSLQADYQAAAAKKNNAKMEEIRKLFETEQKGVVTKIKGLLPEMGTSIVALYATNFLNPETDFEEVGAVADRFQAAGLKYKAAQTFINTVNRKRGTQLGQAAPDFTMSDLKGNTVKLSDLKGKVVILDFWATWCGPCIQSFPAMQQVANKYKDNPNVKILFVNTYERVGKDQWRGNVESFIEQKKWNNYDYLLDMSGEHGGETAMSFGVEGIPAKFCIDKEGKIKYKSTGFMGNENLIAEVSKWIDEASK
jgi:thiol-disulfide isomerase/thioredoxin